MDKHHLKGINKIQQGHKSTVQYHKSTSYTSTSTEHRAPSMSNAHKFKRLLAFYEATSKPHT